MEVLIKDSHAGISYIVLISGYTEREYYINKYCDHNNIKYKNGRHHPDEYGLFINNVEDGVYSVYKMINIMNADDNQLLQLEAMRIDILKEDQYILRFVVRDHESPFHK